MKSRTITTVVAMAAGVSCVWAGVAAWEPSPEPSVEAEVAMEQGPSEGAGGGGQAAAQENEREVRTSSDVLSITPEDDVVVRGRIEIGGVIRCRSLLVEGNAELHIVRGVQVLASDWMKIGGRISVAEPLVDGADAPVVHLSSQGVLRLESSIIGARGADGRRPGMQGGHGSDITLLAPVIVVGKGVKLMGGEGGTGGASASGGAGGTVSTDGSEYTFADGSLDEPSWEGGKGGLGGAAGDEEGFRRGGGGGAGGGAEGRNRWTEEDIQRAVDRAPPSLLEGVPSLERRIKQSASAACAIEDRTE